MSDYPDKSLRIREIQLPLLHKLLGFARNLQRNGRRCNKTVHCRNRKVGSDSASTSRDRSKPAIISMSGLGIRTGPLCPRSLLFRIIIVNVLLVFVLVAFMYDFSPFKPVSVKQRTEGNQKVIELRTLKTQLILERTTIQNAQVIPKRNPVAFFSIPPVPERSQSDYVHSLPGEVMRKYLKYETREYKENIVILTPIHNVAHLLPLYANLLKQLTYPHRLISVVFGEDCSTDGTLDVAKSLAKDLRKESFRRVEVHHFNISGQVGGHWDDVHRYGVQLVRRKHIAKSRNLLLEAGLQDESWCLWIDSDISRLPADIVQQLMSAGKDIVVPACLFLDNGQMRVFDKNTWRETPLSIAKQKQMADNELMLEGYGKPLRLYLTDLRAEGRVVPIDGVGGCTLLIRSELHRKGLIFPEKIIDHHIETEGLAKLAKQMGFGVYGMPFVEVYH